MKNWQKIKENPGLLPQFLIREQAFKSIRQFFYDQNFHEVETPLLVERPSTETYLEFFESALQMQPDIRRRGFLTSSPEYSMKKLLAAGVGNMFQLCKSFRNDEGISRFHNPEFTILEWYRTNADYTHLMDDCEELFLTLLQAVHPERSPDETTFSYQARIFNIARPWLRISVAEAFEKYAQVNIDQLLDRDQLAVVADDKGYQVSSDSTWEELYNQIFLNEIEPALAKLNQPVFLYDYPVAQAALSRRKESDPRFAERFELYVGGIELGNAFSELTDADEQEARLRADLELRPKIGKNTYELDTDFIEALRSGMPPTAGIAVGVDRWIMLLADAPSIHDTMFFPVHDVFHLE